MEVALYSILGIFIGAALQYVFTKVLEEKRHERDLRTQAYADYLRCVSEMKHVFIQKTAPQERELLARFTDAKVRMSLYGTDDVVRSLSRFEELGAQLDSPAQLEAFAALIQNMRIGSSIDSRELHLVLFGTS